MRLPWFALTFAVPPPAPQNEVLLTTTMPKASGNQPTTLLGGSPSRLHHATSAWLATAAAPSAPAPATAPPSKEDILVLRRAFAEFYGVDRDLTKAQELLTDAIARWQAQPPDELAGLLRVRGDCRMLLADAGGAAADYDRALLLLRGPGGDKADPAELPAALLGRARAVRSQGPAVTTALAKQSADDYRTALQLSSREEWSTEEELIEDGVARNPYAAWEWGGMLRRSGQPKEAAQAHMLASQAFDEVGDKARSVMSLIDAGIDLAAADQIKEAESLLEQAVQKTKGIEGRDTSLLQRVIAKEGEGRLALAALLWDDGNRPKAEQVLGDACIRLEQLQADAARRTPTKADKQDVPTLSYSIDDSIRPLEISCTRFRNEAFLSQQLGWPENLEKKVLKLQSLQ